jgi:hypothetical protein
MAEHGFLHQIAEGGCWSCLIAIFVLVVILGMFALFFYIGSNP